MDCSRGPLQGPQAGSYLADRNAKAAEGNKEPPKPGDQTTSQQARPRERAASLQPDASLVKQSDRASRQPSRAQTWGHECQRLEPANSQPPRAHGQPGAPAPRTTKPQQSTGAQTNRTSQARTQSQQQETSPAQTGIQADRSSRSPLAQVSPNPNCLTDNFRASSMSTGVQGYCLVLCPARKLHAKVAEPHWSCRGGYLLPP